MIGLFRTEFFLNGNPKSLSQKMRIVLRLEEKLDDFEFVDCRYSAGEA